MIGRMSNAADTITIRFRGVRGSHPVPGASTTGYGGNTSCQEIRAGGRLFVFDAGTGIIGLGRELAASSAPEPVALLFSHYHHDHIDGFLYFRPAYNPGATVHIFGPDDPPGSGVLRVMDHLSSSAAHPVPFARMGMRRTTAAIAGGDAVVWRKDEPAPRLLREGETASADDVVVKIFKNPLHPLEGVLNFRLEYRGKSYVYATDVEGDEATGDAALADFARGADVLAHDGQYTSADYAANRRGWGHSTVAMAIKTAQMAEVKKLVIIHHDPESDDATLDAMARAAREELPGAVFAREGDVVTV